MTLTPQRRVARTAVAAGLVAALSAAGPIPMAFSADDPSAAAPSDGTVKSAHDKLGSDDADLLAEAKADGDKNVTMMIATAPGQTEQVAKELDAVKGGSVGRTYDKLGYVRATVPTGRADSAIAAAAKLSSVHGIDLRQEIAVDDPTPSADTAKGAAEQATSTATYSGGTGRKTRPGAFPRAACARFASWSRSRVMSAGSSPSISTGRTWGCKRRPTPTAWTAR